MPKANRPSKLVIELCRALVAAGACGGTGAMADAQALEDWRMRTGRRYWRRALA